MTEQWGKGLKNTCKEVKSSEHIMESKLLGKQSRRDKGTEQKHRGT